MSRPLVVTIPHQLGRDEARRRIEAGLGQLVGQVGRFGELVSRWEGDVLHFTVETFGARVPGHVAVGDQDVRLEVTLPGLLARLAERMKGKVEREGQILLGPPKR
jgi:putative polyhydroxyalkanoate system protein